MGNRRPQHFAGECVVGKAVGGPGSGAFYIVYIARIIGIEGASARMDVV